MAVHVPVACLHPHHSISNVVAVVTIHDNINIDIVYIYIYIYILRDVAKKNMNHCGRSKALSTELPGKCLACKSFVILGFCLCVSASSLCLSLCLCLCVLRVVCCCGGGMEGGRRRGETNRTIWLLIPARASLKIAETEQLYQVKRMIGGIGNKLFSIYSQTESV